jgi:hypothetical protein
LKKLKIVVVSSKGGVGKSTISMQLIAPFLYEYNNKSPIKFYEFDDENNDCLSYGDSKLTSRKIEGVSSPILRESITEIFYRDETACFDIGGNKTTTIVLNALNESGMIHFVDLVVIPLLDGEQDGINTIIIYSLLKDMRPDLKFVFVLNRAKNHRYIEYQFDNFFGDVRGIFENNNSVQNWLYDQKDNYITMLDDDIIKYSRRFGLTIYEIAHQDRDFISLLRLNINEMTKDREVKLTSFKNYIKKASTSYYEDVLKLGFNKLKIILERENDNKTL